MSLEPDVLAYLDLVERAKRPPLFQLPVPEARVAYALGCEMNGLQRDASVATADMVAHTSTGPLNLRSYWTVESERSLAPGLVFFHGGGWVVGSLDTHDSICRELARASGCRIVAVDYRLAPEHPFPAAIDDALASYQWIAQNADGLGIDASRLGVVGDSAGGFLATFVSLSAGDYPKEIRPKLQLLFYPVTDLAAESAGYSRVASGLPFTSVTMRWFRDHYVQRALDADDVRLAPLNALDLTASPDTLIVTSGFDPLCEEGTAYARRLQDAGVRVNHLHLADQIHGFLTLGLRMNTARTVLDWASAYTRQKFMLNDVPVRSPLRRDSTDTTSSEDQVRV
ncbi:alpha/beta hydrolase [Paraburkholderia dioscoreae]|uniref:Acetyl esterase n=1 Tax=Paraburkholderia dioscoreae TaxID=2604047 RepID=A0A5Q4ZV75_9BURK|nr:alpha/beta hydrolase [Paraburkholderia dioscoreae]VVD33692.1 Acetyl esterase [Paraburkholderia dioscoreae]